MDRERFQNLIPALLLTVALLGFILHQVGWLQPIENVLLRLSAPLQEGLSTAANRLGDLTQAARDLRNLRRRNEELEAQNARLLLENIRLKEIEHETVLLRELLNFALDNPTLEVQGARVVGRVIGREPDNLQRYITLDVGREAGIERNMPVVTERGLVGRIDAVGDRWSRVLLIIDPSSAVNALTQSTRASGLIQGLPDGSLEMRKIPQGDTVSVGDTVFTSGLGGNLPRQILIGQITGVERKDYELYQTARVRPTVDFDHLEMVLVVVGFEPIEPTAEETVPDEQ